MRVVDLNLLLYAVNRDAVHHRAARAWWEKALNGSETIGLPWIVLLGFLRLATNARVLPRPLSAEQVLAVVDGWLAQPVVRIPTPGEDHWHRLQALLAQAGTAGNLTTDAHLAALAMDHGAELCTTDADFGRFPHLRWSNPLAQRPIG
jgi:hypothetical protein